MRSPLDTARQNAAMSHLRQITLKVNGQASNVHPVHHP